MIQQTQALSIVDRVTAVFATWLITTLLGKGYITTSQAAEYAPLLIAVLAAVYAYYKNRNIALLRMAGNVVGKDGKKTVILASPELANATLEQNIMSNTSTPKKIAAEVDKTSVVVPKV